MTEITGVKPAASSGSIATRAGCGALMMALAGLLTWGWFAPFISDGEIDDVRAEAERRRAEAGAVVCSRTPLGDADPFTLEERDAAFATLTECFEAVRSGYRLRDVPTREVPEVLAASMESETADSEPDSVERPPSGDPDGQDPVIETWTWSFDAGDAPSQPAAGESYSPQYSPPAPPGYETPGVRAALTLCAPLEEVLARVAASDDLCAGPAALEGVSNEWHGNRSLRIAEGAGVLARERWAQGHASQALVILENAIAAIRDERRGAVGWSYTTNSVLAEGLVTSHYFNLLVGPTELSPDQINMHLDRLSRLRERPPSPTRTGYFDLVPRMEEAILTNPTERLGLLAAESGPSCGDDEPSPMTCLERLPVRELRSEMPEELVVRLFRPFVVGQVVNDARRTVGRWVADLANADRTLVMLGDALRVSAARDTCPPSVAFEPIPGTQGACSLRHLSGDQYELVSPPLNDTRFLAERLVALVLCPPAEPTWEVVVE